MMADLAATEKLFFERAGMDRGRVTEIVKDAVKGADDGELFLEYRLAESLTFDDGHLRNASFDASQGFGLRAVSGELTGLAHASELSEAAIKRAAETVKSARSGRGGTLALPPQGTNRSLYTGDNPLEAVDMAAKVKLLAEIDAYARGLDRRVSQVMASLAGSWQAVRIIRPDGTEVGDIRPLVRLSVQVVERIIKNSSDSSSSS